MPVGDNTRPGAVPAEIPTGTPKQELHLHFHGVTEDVAAILRRQVGQ